MFPGQGSQKTGMGEELLNLYPDLLIDEFEETLGWSLKQTILQSDQSEITKTNIATVLNQVPPLEIKKESQKRR